MSTLQIDRRLLYNEELTLPEVVLLAIVQDAGEDGFVYGTRYLTRALNLTVERVNLVRNILVENEYLIDTGRYANPGVMRLSMLYLGPATMAILEDRKIDSGGTNHTYIPCANLDEIIEDEKV